MSRNSRSGYHTVDAHMELTSLLCKTLLEYPMDLGKKNEGIHVKMVPWVLKCTLNPYYEAGNQRDVYGKPLAETVQP